MKKRKILTGLLLVSIAALSFVACGKKKNNKTNATTKSNITTKANTTTKKSESLSGSKCYANIKDDMFVRTEVENSELTDLKLLTSSYNCISIRPKIDNKKFVSLSVFSSNTSSKEVIKVITKNSKATPISYNSFDAFDEEFNLDYNVSIKLTDDSIEIYYKDSTYTISVNGLVNGGFSEITSSGITVGDDVSLKRDGDKIIALENEIVVSEVTLKKDLFLYDDGEYQSYLKYKDDGSIQAYFGEFNGDDLNLYFDLNITMDETGYIKKIVDGKTTYDYTYNSDKTKLEVLRTTEVENHMLSTLSTRSKHEYTLDEFGRTLEEKFYTDSASGFTLQHTYTYTYDDRGNFLSEEFDDEHKKYVYTYNDKGLLIGEKQYSTSTGSDILKEYSEITYTTDYKDSTYKKYIVSGSTNKLDKDFKIEYSGNNITLYDFKYYDGEGKLTDDSYKSEFTYNSNNTKATFKYYCAKYDGSAFYLEEEGRYEYSTVDGHLVRTLFEKDYEEDGTYEECKYVMWDINRNSYEDYYKLSDTLNRYILTYKSSTIYNNDGTSVDTSIYYKLDSSNNEVIKSKEERYYDDERYTTMEKKYAFDGTNYLITEYTTYFEGTSWESFDEDTTYTDDWKISSINTYEYEIVENDCYQKSVTYKTYNYEDKYYVCEYYENYNIDEDHYYIDKLYDYKRYDINSDGTLELIKTETIEFELDSDNENSHRIKETYKDSAKNYIREYDWEDEFNKPLIIHKDYIEEIDTYVHTYDYIIMNIEDNDETLPYMKYEYTDNTYSKLKTRYIYIRYSNSNGKINIYYAQQYGEDGETIVSGIAHQYDYNDDDLVKKLTNETLFPDENAFFHNSDLEAIFDEYGRYSMVLFIEFDVNDHEGFQTITNIYLYVNDYNDSTTEKCLKYTMKSNYLEDAGYHNYYIDEDNLTFDASKFEDTYQELDYWYVLETDMVE